MNEYNDEEPSDVITGAMITVIATCLRCCGMEPGIELQAMGLEITRRLVDAHTDHQGQVKLVNVWRATLIEGVKLLENR